MKLNFWQWIGVLLLLFGAWMMLKKYIVGKPGPTGTSQPVAR